MYKWNGPSSIPIRTLYHLTYSQNLDSLPKKHVVEIVFVTLVLALYCCFFYVLSCMVLCNPLILRGCGKIRAANLQNTSSIFCWKNFRIFDNFSVSLNLFLIRLKTVIMATSYLLWWDPLAPSENSSGFFRYYRNRKCGRARVTTTCGREKNECFGD